MARFSRRVTPALLCAVSLGLGWVSTAQAWGPTGHRIGATIAETYLSAAARDHIEAILGAENLAQASTWADEMRSNPDKFWQKTASPLHYVTVPTGKRYADVGAPRKGDAITGLTRFRATLLNPQSSLAQKQLALRFTIHIVADLHQPLHVGNGKDSGGNRVKVKFMGKSTNLHSVWDSKLINQRELSFTEWANWLGRDITPEQVKEWSDPDPLVWIAESAALREDIYPKGKSVSWGYVYQHMPAVKMRLKQSGVRLASYLNGLWKQR